MPASGLNWMGREEGEAVNERVDAGVPGVERVGVGAGVPESVGAAVPDGVGMRDAVCEAGTEAERDAVRDAGTEGVLVDEVVQVGCIRREGRERINGIKHFVFAHAHGPTARVRLQNVESRALTVIDAANITTFTADKERV